MTTVRMKPPVVNRLCLNLCDDGLCGINSYCSINHNKLTCSCPPGTTGNPTVKCTALASETYTFRPPISYTTPSVDVTILPDSQQTAKLDPIGVTVFTEETTIPFIPPVSPIMPEIFIYCQNNDDCDVSNSCINKLCYESCSLGICGKEANCVTVEHRPVCLCPHGTTGDPQVKCYSVITEKNPSRPAFAEQPKITQNEIIPSQFTTERPEPLAEFTTVKLTTKYKEHIIIPVAPPITIGCVVSGKCPTDQSCVNKLCINVCHTSLCGLNAECVTQNHRPTCECPPGMTGNPTIQCSAITSDYLTVLPPIRDNVTVHSINPIIPGVINPTTSKPIGLPAEPFPTLPEYVRPDPPPCFTICCHFL